MLSGKEQDFSFNPPALRSIRQSTRRIVRSLELEPGSDKLVGTSMLYLEIPHDYSAKVLVLSIHSTILKHSSHNAADASLEVQPQESLDSNQSTTTTIRARSVGRCIVTEPWLFVYQAYYLEVLAS